MYKTTLMDCQTQNADFCCKDRVAYKTANSQANKSQTTPPSKKFNDDLPE